MEEKPISFNNMDRLISKWLFATDDAVSTFKIMAQQINIQDMKIVLNEQKIVELWKKFNIALFLELKINNSISEINEHFKQITELVEILEKQSYCFDKNVFPNSIRTAVYSMLENIFLNFNELSDLLAEIHAVEKEQLQHLDDPVVQCKLKTLKRVQNLEEINNKIIQMEKQINIINNYLPNFCVNKNR